MFLYLLGQIFELDFFPFPFIGNILNILKLLNIFPILGIILYFYDGICTAKGFSKSDLVREIGVHYSQIGRYEEKCAQPSADVLVKLVNALEVFSDYLMNGTSDDLVGNTDIEF
jgi:hypothetical protein